MLFVYIYKKTANNGLFLSKDFLLFASVESKMSDAGQPKKQQTARNVGDKVTIEFLNDTQLQEPLRKKIRCDYRIQNSSDPDDNAIIKAWNDLAPSDTDTPFLQKTEQLEKWAISDIHNGKIQSFCCHVEYKFPDYEQIDDLFRTNSDPYYRCAFYSVRENITNALSFALECLHDDFKKKCDIATNPLQKSVWQIVFAAYADDILQLEDSTCIIHSSFSDWVDLSKYQTSTVTGHAEQMQITKKHQ